MSSGFFVNLGLIFAASASAIAALSVSACNTTTENSPESKLSAQEKARVNELKLEMELGRTMASYLLQAYGTLPDEEVVKYVNHVGTYVASRSDSPDRVYMFEVLNTDSINAFSAPGGYVMLTAGAINLAESEAELAMILGHEIAHVERQHMFKTLLSKEKERAKEKEESRKKLPFSVRMRDRPKVGDSAFSNNVAKYFASKGGGIGFSVVSAVKSGIGVVLQTGLDHSLEYEADERGVQYAARSGYKSDALITYLRRLNAKKASVNATTLDKTHPKIEDRETKILTTLKKQEILDAVGAEGKDRFLKFKKRLKIRAQRQQAQR